MQAQNGCGVKNKRKKEKEVSLQKIFTGVLFCPKKQKQQNLIISAGMPELETKILVLQVYTSEDLIVRKFTEKSLQQRNKIRHFLPIPAS